MSGPDTFDIIAFPNAGNSFSNSNRTVVIAQPTPITGGCFGMAQLVEGKNSGKNYIEITPNVLTTTGGQLTSVGVVPSWGASSGGLVFAGYWGGSAAACGVRYDLNGNIWYKSTTFPWGTFTGWTAGDTIGVELDFVTPALSFRVNGGAWNTVTGSMATFIANGSSVYPCVGSGGANAQFTINTGQIPFVFTPPAGFTAGWPNTTAGTYFGSFATNGQGPNQGVVGVSSVVVSPYVASYTGNVTALQFAPNGAWTLPPGADPIIAVMYDATGGGGAPGTLLGSTSAGVGASAGVITYTFASPIPVVSGTTYYLGVLVDGQSGGTTNFVCQPLYTGQVGSYTVGATYPTPPPTFGSGATRDYSFPAIAMATPTPPPPVVSGNSFAEII